MIILLIIALLFIFVILYGHKITMDNIIDRVEKLEKSSGKNKE